MKKIIFITLRSDYGGGPHHVDQLVEYLPSEYELYMAYPKNGKPYGASWANNDRIKKRISIPYRRFSLTSLFLLWRFVIANDIDIIHSHGNGAGIYSRMLKMLGCRAKVVHTFHGITARYPNKFKTLLHHFLGRFLKRFTDYFVLVSNGEYKIGKQLGYLVPDKSKVIYNGVEKPIDCFSNKARTNKIKVVTLTRFDYQKNMDMAYQIAKAFRDNKNVNFVWVGNGEHYNRLREWSEKENVNIEFVGFSNEPMKHLVTADIYLSTSRFEGLPYALIEALSVGLPVVATDVVGNNEVVADGYNGFLVRNEKEAVKSIDRLANDKHLRANMSDNALEYFERYFTISRMIEELVKLY